MRQVITLLLLLAAAPAGAQVFLGAEVGPDAFARGESASIDTAGEDAFAWALSAEVSSPTLCAVFESTAPEREIFNWLRTGLYRQELAALLLLSEKKSVPFKTLAAELPKAGGLRGLAKKHQADALALFSEAGALKAAADARMPLFLAVSTYTPAAAEVSAAPPALPDAEK
jgi:hypothetical protein